MMTDDKYSNILREYFFSNQAQTSDNPLAIQITHGKGDILYDINGKEYIDCISGIAVSSFGHNNKEILKSVTQQINKHLHVMVYGDFILSPQVELTKALCSLLPNELSNIYYTNSGAEAVEGALKLAKKYTGRPKIISCYNAYHGSTHGALSIMGSEHYKRNFRPLLPDIHHIKFNNFDDINKIDNNTACVIVEVIQAEAGIRLPQNNYLQALRKKCNEIGALLIFDEVQTGMGRTGSMFAFEQYELMPDILILAKAFGGGFPLGAFISSKEIMKTLSFNPVLGHITTFGGHAVSCAASLAAINLIKSKNLIETTKEKEKIIFNAFKNLSNIKEIRGRGLFFAIELINAEICQKVIQSCIAKGVITDWFLFAPESIRLAPPLTISNKNLKKALSIIIETIKENTK